MEDQEGVHDSDGTRSLTDPDAMQDSQSPEGAPHQRICVPSQVTAVTPTAKMDTGVWEPMGNDWGDVDLLDVDGLSDNYVWAVGQNGTMLHHSGEWQALPKVTEADLTQVLAVGESDVWVAGESGALFHLSSSGWESIALAQDDWQFLRGDEKHVWVGSGTKLYEQDGDCWTEWAVSDMPLVDLWVSPAGKTWAIDAVQAYSFDGTEWLASQGSLAPDHRRWVKIAGAGEEPRLVSQTGGTYGKVDGEWKVLHDPVTPKCGCDAYYSAGTIVDVAGLSGGGEPVLLQYLPALDQGGLGQHYDASEPSTVVRVQASHLFDASGTTAIWGTDTTSLWSVGARGAVRRNGDSVVLYEGKLRGESGAMFFSEEDMQVSPDGQAQFIYWKEGGSSFVDGGFYEKLKGEGSADGFSLTWFGETEEGSAPYRASSVAQVSGGYLVAGIDLNEHTGVFWTWENGVLSEPLPLTTPVKGRRAWSDASGMIWMWSATELMSWDGDGWEMRATSVSDMWGTEVVWAVGADGIQRWDGEDWLTVETEWKPIEIFGLTAEKIWAWDGDQLLHYDGNEWAESAIDVPLSPDTLAIDAEGHLWASQAKRKYRTQLPAVELEE